MLVYVFGTHYGNSFYQMQTPIYLEIIDEVIELVEDGEYSPSEIDEMLRSR
tara:strand:- start:6620 stop:6772 length:153 start_codon:yes stop_codon:yes gene_type:complete